MGFDQCFVEKSYTGKCSWDSDLGKEQKGSSKAELKSGSFLYHHHHHHHQKIGPQSQSWDFSGSDVGKGAVKLLEDGGGHVAENGDPSTPLMIDQVIQGHVSYEDPSTRRQAVDSICDRQSYLL